jgi:hypothetical protein
LPNGQMPIVQKVTLRSEPDAAGHRTVVISQIANDSVRYFDVAGYPGRTLGLPAAMAH